MDIICVWEAFICLKKNPHYEEAGYFYHVAQSKKLVSIHLGRMNSWFNLGVDLRGFELETFELVFQQRNY